MNWHYKYSIKVKMIIAFIAVSLISVLLMGILAHYNYSKATKNDLYSITEQAVTRINYQFDLYFNQLAQSTYTTIAGPILTNTEVFSSYESGLIQAWLRGEILTRENFTSVEDILNKYIALNYSGIEGIFLKSKSNDLISSQRSFMTNRNLQDEAWYSIPLTDEIMILPTYYTNYNAITKDVAVVSLLIPIYNTRNLQLAGNLIISLKLNEVIKILGESKLGETGYFFIVSDDGVIVYHPDERWISQNISDTPFSILKFDTTHSIQSWEGEDHLVSHSDTDLTGWNIVAFVPLREMANGLIIARNATVFAACILFALIIMVVPILSSWFVRPISNLKNLMARLQHGDMNVRANYVKGRDEIQILNNSFNKMTINLNELIQTVSELKIREVNLRLKQKEAMIQALQNQINPHLLYNTLDIIKSIAYLEDVPMIETMSSNLASIYRYSVNLSDIEVEIREELRHVEKYLEIIHVRFTMHFTSYIYVNEKYMEQKIVKFTLQPIIENAVKYAVEPNNGKASIIVNVYNDKQDLIIEIVDNGQGISEERLKNLNRKLTTISSMDQETLAHQDTVGLVNVHTRLILQYGIQYGLTINSFPERGTIVSIKIPLKL